MIDLGTLGGKPSYAQGINDNGVVVGLAALPTGSDGHGFVYDGSGSMEDLNDLVDPKLGWTIGTAFSVNDRGQIAVDGYQEYGYFHALLLTPVPEPSSLCLIWAGLVGLLTIRTGGRFFRRRRSDKAFRVVLSQLQR